MNSTNLLDGVSLIANFSRDKIFYRKIFYQCEDFLLNSETAFCCFTGPRKIGKTVALKQLASKYENHYYIDFKTAPEDKIFEIYNMLKENNNIIVLIDEITHLKSFDQYVLGFAEIYTNLVWKETINFKVIITGSESLNIEYLCRKAFASNCTFVRGTFLDFEEWLVFSNKISSYGDDYKATPDDYKDYVMTSYSFSKIEDYEVYLRSCIDETIISNEMSLSYLNYYIRNIDNEVNIEDIIAVSYVSLMSLHDGIKKSDYNKYQDLMIKFYTAYYNSGGTTYHSREDFMCALENSIVVRISKINKISLDRFKSILLYLIKLDFIICVEQSDNLVYSELFQWLSGNVEWEHIKTIRDFLHKFKIVFKHPLFFVSIGNSILKELGVKDYSEWYSGMLLGSIYECNLRGLLSYRYRDFHQLEYHDSFYNEVDYVNPYAKLLIEMTISDKKQKDVHFDCISNNDEYCKVVTSRTKNNYPYRIYSEYLLELSRGVFIKDIIS